MCGIFGIINGSPATQPILAGLARLEYRGYDSAGIATLVGGRIERRRASGRLSNLASLMERDPIAGTIGIGHTRWATHGAPTDANAHPHATERVVVVHNGIIENHHELRNWLIATGRMPTSQTDSEVVPLLIDTLLEQGLSPRDAVLGALERLEGSYALAILFAGHEDMIIAARRGSPLVVGLGDDESFVASDVMALVPHTRRMIYLDDGQIAEITRNGAYVFDRYGQPVERTPVTVDLDPESASLDGHRYFMHKEIHEQPKVAASIVEAYGNPNSFARLPFDLAHLPRLTIVACGTSYYAGLVAKHWLEDVAGLPVEVDIASEYRYRRRAAVRGEAALFISQSGETADTLACLRMVKQRGMPTLALVNVMSSSMAHEADLALPLHAGPELGVASTKAFIAQLMVLAHFAAYAGHRRPDGDVEAAARLLNGLRGLPDLIGRALDLESACAGIANRYYPAGTMLYLGRGISHPIALEGALKMKEITYLHAEGYPAGELKHGPIALVDRTCPVVAVAPSDELFEKTGSNLQEVAARSGRIILIGNEPGIAALASITEESIALPEADPLITPVVAVIPLQLLAYHTALARGTDVDRPRNLAKSVTVE
jgi:glucosamine--fructose-6-phosphate aminotransferase (isomerizing)